LAIIMSSITRVSLPPDTNPRVGSNQNVEFAENANKYSVQVTSVLDIVLAPFKWLAQWDECKKAHENGDNTALVEHRVALFQIPTSAINTLGVLTVKIVEIGSYFKWFADTSFILPLSQAVAGVGGILCITELALEIRGLKRTFEFSSQFDNESVEEQITTLKRFLDAATWATNKDSQNVEQSKQELYRMLGVAFTEKLLAKNKAGEPITEEDIKITLEQIEKRKTAHTLGAIGVLILLSGLILGAVAACPPFLAFALVLLGTGVGAARFLFWAGYAESEGWENYELNKWMNGTLAQIKENILIPLQEKILIPFVEAVTNEKNPPSLTNAALKGAQDMQEALFLLTR